MPVLVTAFGPFGDRESNVSSLVLEELRKKRTDIRTRIFPVDSVIAPSRLKQAIHLIRPSAILMLGESANCDRIQLETTAWNENSFSIADIGGRKPLGKAIRPGAPPFLKSSLPLGEIRKSLESIGHNPSLSDDPGRYLCNQLFFTALDHIRSKGPDVPTGFIHLPLESNRPIKETREAVDIIIREIEIQIGSTN